MIFRLPFKNIFSSFGGLRPRTQYKSIFPIYLNFSLNFRENFDKLLKHFQKSQNFFKNFQKIINVSLLFKILVKPFEFEKPLSFLFLQCKKYPPIAPGTPSIREILHKRLKLHAIYCFPINFLCIWTATCSCKLRLWILICFFKNQCSISFLQVVRFPLQI